MDNIKKSNAKKLDVTNAYEVDCPNCNRSFIIDCGEDKKPTYCPYCDYILGSVEIKFDRSFFYDADRPTFVDANTPSFFIEDSTSSFVEDSTVPLSITVRRRDESWD